MLIDYQTVLPVRAAFNEKKFEEMVVAFTAEQKMGKDMDQILKTLDHTHDFQTAKKEMGEKSASITYAKSDALIGFLFEVQSKNRKTRENLNVILNSEKHEIYLAHSSGFYLESMRSHDDLLNKYWFAEWLMSHRYFGINGIFTVSARPVTLRFDDERSVARMLNKEIQLYAPAVLLRCTEAKSLFAGCDGGEFTVMQEDDPELFSAMMEDYPDLSVPGDNTVTVIYPNQEIQTVDCSKENIVGCKFGIHQFMLSSEYPVYSVFWDTAIADETRRRCGTDKTEQQDKAQQNQSVQQTRSTLRVNCTKASDGKISEQFQIPMRQLTGDDFPEGLVPSFVQYINRLENCELVDIFYAERLAHTRASIAQIGLPLLLKSNRVKEMYQFEQRAIILRALMNYRRQYATNGTREAEILDAIIASNEAAESIAPLTERRERIDKAFIGFRTMTPPLQHELESMGFRVKQNGKHIKLTAPESKATCVCASTSSDVNGGKNMAKQFNRTFH